MYCIITTLSVEWCWHCSDETVHYKSDEIVFFCGFICATPSPITVFINFVFFTFIIHSILMKQSVLLQVSINLYRVVVTSNFFEFTVIQDQNAVIKGKFLKC